MITCQNKTKSSEEEKDLFELIRYPAEYDTLDCSRYRTNWIPYPCLKLHKKMPQEIDSLYGKPLGTRIDTLYFGRRKTIYPYDPDVAKILSNVPVAKVTATSRKELGHYLILYFIEYHNENVVFYGYRYNPQAVMLD